MEYVYACMLLHSAKKEINEANIKSVLKAAGIAADEGRMKSLLAALEGVNIEEAIKAATMPVVAAAPVATAPTAKKEEKKEEEKKDERKEEEALEGLGALFG